MSGLLGYSPFGSFSDDDPIRRFQAKIASYHTQAEQLRPVLSSCRDAIARCDSNQCRSATPMVDFRRGRVVVILMMATDKMDHAVDLMRELAKEGIRSPEKKHEDKSLFDIIAMREYQLTDQVFLSVMLVGESCKMVQVGTKEVPVFDIQCGETVDGKLAQSPTPQISQP